MGKTMIIGSAIRAIVLYILMHEKSDAAECSSASAREKLLA
jgi:hypothetical protein